MLIYESTKKPVIINDLIKTSKDGEICVVERLETGSRGNKILVTTHEQHYQEYYYYVFDDIVKV
jgi:hypothetical protein